jgi:hypothetical protein
MVDQKPATTFEILWILMAAVLIAFLSGTHDVIITAVCIVVQSTRGNT